ncbi:MAG TPA: VIT domain-containing protein [Myxococcaceae bacterium]|nr:VIT domain-containing protein [Myxococcaceae bacterium]
MNAPTPSTGYESSGGRLVSADGRTLPLLGASLRADAKGGLCRVVLEQRFANPYQEPLRVTYKMPLPADGAVSGYAFTLGDVRIEGEVDRKHRARERFERAILEGHTAGLVTQERQSVFTQELGNLPPGEELVAELTVDQKLAWLPEGAWEWRFPTVVAPRYLGEPGRVADHDRVTVNVADAPLSPRVAMAIAVRDAVPSGGRPESPSHPVRASLSGGRWDVTLSEEAGARLDRDVVVRWAAAASEPGVALETAWPAGRASGYGLLTLTPPAPFAATEPTPRDLILLVDTSGSMSGEPLDMARRILGLMVDSLGEQDQLEMISFSSAPSRWKRGAVKAGESNRRDAQKWLSKLQASGGTEMRAGVLEALAPLREGAQRQVVIVTDGLIGFEDEIIRTIYERLPSGSRVHVIGVGSAVNRGLSFPASRAGRGVELIAGIGEDVERAAQRILARTCAPVLTEVSVSGSALEKCAPGRAPDVFAGAPSLLSVALRTAGGELVVRARTADGGAFERRISVPAATAPGDGNPALAKLYGRELVEDLELQIAAGFEKGAMDREIERAGLDFQISTRLTSWVAVSKARTVDPGAPTRHEEVPVELPHGMSAEGMGLRRRQAAAPAQAVLAQGMAKTAPAPKPAPKVMDLDARIGGVQGESPQDDEGEAYAVEDVLESSFDEAPAELEPEPVTGASPPPPAKEEFRFERAKKVPAPARPSAPAMRPPSREVTRPEPEELKKRAEEPEDKAKEKKDAGAGGAARRRQRQGRRLVGRIVYRSGRQVVLEIVVSGGPLAWTRPIAAVALLAEGPEIPAKALVDGTTRDGTHPEGVTVRVVLELSMEAGSILEVGLYLGIDRIDVVVQG